MSKTIRKNKIYIKAEIFFTYNLQTKQCVIQMYFLKYETASGVHQSSTVSPFVARPSSSVQREEEEELTVSGGKASSASSQRERVKEGSKRLKERLNLKQFFFIPFSVFILVFNTTELLLHNSLYANLAHLAAVSSG